MAKKMPKYEAEYRKQLKRIKALMRRANKRGIIWLDDPTPKRPKKVTAASVRRLSRLTPAVLYSKSFGIDDRTGELVSVSRTGRIRKPALPKLVITPEPIAVLEPGAQLPKEAPGKVLGESQTANMVINNIMDEIDNYPKSPFRDELKALINQLVSEMGAAAVARAFEALGQAGMTINAEIMYKDVEYAGFVNALLSRFPGIDGGRLYELGEGEELDWQVDWDNG